MVVVYVPGLFMLYTLHSIQTFADFHSWLTTL